MSDLKPCPICGSQVVIFSHPAEGSLSGTKNWIMCLAKNGKPCLFHYGVDYYFHTNTENLVKEFNCRYEEEKYQAQVEAMCDLCGDYVTEIDSLKSKLELYEN